MKITILYNDYILFLGIIVMLVNGNQICLTIKQTIKFTHIIIYTC